MIYYYMKIKLNKLSKFGQINNILKILVILIVMSIVFSIINYTNSLEKDSVEMFIEGYDSRPILTSVERGAFLQKVNNVLSDADTLTANIELGDDRSQELKDRNQAEYEANKKHTETDAQKQNEDISALKKKVKDQEQQIIDKQRKSEEEQRKLEEQQIIDKQRKSEEEQRKLEEHRRSLSENDRAIKHYTEYKGILQMGNYSKNVGETDFSNSESIEDAANGCVKNLSFEDAQKTCDNAKDCNSFYSYNGYNEGRVCFKNNSNSRNRHIPSSDPNSSFFIKN
jgi:Skp family chaperone for outer membrane proteins